ncbi:peptidoglycan-recognition protein LC isoform X6 [Drosophila navojoa]|uniref:peptidoglycan-recognition protein LC isoform X6 n=1 Tax=Drosophila navojoa TaxID=7232 RepID=UPI0011BFD210|nr:peptidoglycan-recognition protein LC isoform X6 [Drosophila navojoa]
MSRNALNYCVKCRGLIHRDRLACGAACGRASHAKCSGLSEQQLQIIHSSPNINWHCDSCQRQLFNVKLELCLKQHEKRLEILEQGLAIRGKVNKSCKEPVLCPFLPSSIATKAVFITAAFALFTIGLLVVLATTTNIFSKSLSKNSENIGGGLVLRFVPRAVWLAQPAQRHLPQLNLPVPMVIVLPTNSENCSSQAQCVFRVRFLQTFDIESQQRDDIAYNFLIGGDGNVYMGRGWDTVGAHMNGYNTVSLSFAYIGSFRKQQPSAKQLSVTRLLLDYGVEHGKISSNYQLVGASTLAPTVTEYKAELLYQSFANFTHWTTAH